MDAITEHHYLNIAQGKTGKDKDGKMQTVVSTIVEIDGVETLIPRLWDGEVRSVEDATKFAIESGVEWPTASGDDAIIKLQEMDDDIHKAFTDQTSPEEAQFILDSQYEETGFARGGLNLADGMKGRSEEDKEIAEEKEQVDVAKADTDEDGFVSPAEREIQLALQKNELIDEEDVPMKMNHGGMSMGYGVTGYDEISGNPIPIGSTAENVRDDIDAQLSTDEYVLPANVVKWHGLKYIMDMQAEAEMGLMSMHLNGLIQNDEQEESSGEDTSDASVSDESDTGQEKTKKKSKAQEGDTVACPECGGEGCEHCDFKGYHDSGMEITTVQVDDKLTDEGDKNISPKSKNLPTFVKNKTKVFAI